MTTKREACLAALLTRIESTDTPAYRSRAEAVKRAEMPVAIITPITDSADTQIGKCYVDRRLTVAIQVWVHGDIPDQEADPVLADIHAAIMADTSLGGTAVDCQILEDDFRLAATDGAIVSKYMIWYRHSEEDLTQ
jgi:hypothetical protein